MKSGEWVVTTDPFWTYPHVYSELESADPQLYSTMAEAKLVIFKGDLNYRKLVGDINWETTVPFKTSLQVQTGAWYSFSTFIFTKHHSKDLTRINPHFEQSLETKVKTNRLRDYRKIPKR